MVYMLPAKRYNRQNATIHRRTKRGKGLPYIVAFCRSGQAKRYNKKKKEEKKRKKEEKKKKRRKREKKCAVHVLLRVNLITNGLIMLFSAANFTLC